MEYLSSSRDPNNQDSLPPQSLQRAHDVTANLPEAQSTSVGVVREAECDSQRSRKKQKSESNNEYDAQIDQLQLEIAAVKQRLNSPWCQLLQEAFEMGKRCIETKQKAATMKRKLAEHAHWLQRVSSLMETAPLFESAVVSDKKQPSVGAGRDGMIEPSLQALSEWRGESKEQVHPRFILGERLRAAVDISQDNAARLLHDASANGPSFPMALQFEVHGWKISTGTLRNDHMAFICQRQLGAGEAKDVATALWDFVQRDELYRTFVPLVQDSMITYKESDRSLSCRMLQLSPESSQQAVATVESIRSTRNEDGQESSWQISMEAVHDHYLCTFVADASADSVIPNTAPPVKLDLGLQMSKLNMHNEFVMGARVTKTDKGIDILIAGSARFDLLHYRDPTFDLLQHFVSFLPVYEDLHLTPLSEDKAATQSA